MNSVIDVCYISQMPKWPTGCECVSAVMLLNYFNCKVDVDDFIEYLPTSRLIKKEGRYYGESPHEFFIGNPYDRHSFGCYANVIIRVINQYTSFMKLGLEAKDISLLSTKEMIQQYIQNGVPVLYWATINLKPSFPGTSWILQETKEVFQWIANEHCMLLVGEQGDNYIFNDPWNNNGIMAYPKELTEQRHKEMLSMAVVVQDVAKEKAK